MGRDRFCRQAKVFFQWYPIFVSFGELGYQMATKKGGKPLGRRGCRNCQILDGYQLATKGTFSYEKAPFFYFCSSFCNVFSSVRGVVLG